MIQNKINDISSDVKKFLERKSKLETKISDIESKMNKMQDYISTTTNVDNHFNLDEKSKISAFNDFIKKGIESPLLKKDLSGNNTGGVVLRSKLYNKIISDMNETSPMRILASADNISTRSLDVIMQHENFSSGWVGEDADRPTTDAAKLRTITINVHELYAQPKATQNLINDSEINLEKWIREQIVDSFTKLENKAFISGDGTNQPFGLLNNTQIEKVSVEAEVSSKMLLNFINQLHEGYLTKARFLMNRKTLSAIQSLQDNTGRFILQESLSSPLKQTIFGIPVVISENMPDIAKGKCAIAIGDFKSGYKIVDRANISLVRDPYTEKPYVKFYAVKRVGGNVINPSAIKFAKFS